MHDFLQNQNCPKSSSIWRVPLSCVVLRRHVLHPTRPLAHCLQSPNAALFRCQFPTSPLASGGGRHSCARREHVPCPYGGLHVLRGAEAGQPVEQGDELLQGETLPQGGRLATLLDVARNCRGMRLLEEGLSLWWFRLGSAATQGFGFY
ncbi:hypothetical protein DEO72_LG3g225 [Vigna unguiculata]|uniref:Uncharacterized protein n=1 Tax=Vigna unguiculata TaxID=3917 RepID=A0A4D6LBG9_VIGUN|nr:hypothetical protein DEO72_LG3g225 [Vigna unguiculata]